MAKRSTTKLGTSRVRFIMLEAEMPEGDLTEITNAIQNALKPTITTIQRNPARQKQVLTVDEIDEGENEIAEAEINEGDFVSNSPSKPRSSKPRKTVTQKILDIDIDTEVSFASYAEKYKPETVLDRHLTAVAYFDEHRKDEDAISANHVYTCFRKVGWPTGKKDFSQPLRDLKAKQLLVAGPSRGTYAINHIGIDRVHNLAND